MESIKVGSVYKPAVGMGEGVKFTLSFDGALLLYAFDDPTPEEIAEMKAGKSFELRYAEIAGILWVTSKCGNLEWTDAPYNPRLSSSLPPSDFEEGEGLALTLVMVDSRTAVVKALRVIGLETRFSHDLAETASWIKEFGDPIDEPMTEHEAESLIRHTMATCSSEHLAKIAPSHARFRL